MDKQIKNIGRKLRVLRLHAIVRAYSAYTQMELNREIMLHKNDWNTAEKTKCLIEFFFPDKELKVEQFIYNQNELSEKALDFHDEFKSWISVAEFLGIPEKTITAFCKNVDKTCSIFRLKSTGHLHYPTYFNAIYRFLDGKINKEDMMKSFVEYSIFTGKATPLRLSLLRHSVIEIEKLINEIILKQATRSGKSTDEFIKESQLPEEKFAGVPFENNKYLQRDEKRNDE